MARKHPDTCETCRRRKVKCSQTLYISRIVCEANNPEQGDRATPKCQNCNRLRLQCDQPAVDYKFIVHINEPMMPRGSRSRVPSPASPLLMVTTAPMQLESYHHSETGLASIADAELQHAADLSQREPRAAIDDQIVAHFFSHYLDTLASWYDLNDANATFRTEVPIRALEFPLLFRAIIAFSAIHWSKATGGLPHVAFAFHAVCVKDLLSALNRFSDYPGELLAASALLRSYEILSESMQNPQCHLLGGYSFSSSIPMNLSDWGLPQAAFWNYLREEITVGLAYNRPVRLAKAFPDLERLIVRRNVGDDMRANMIAYILARIINLYSAFSEMHVEDGNTSPASDHFNAWTGLHSVLELWNKHLPSTFRPFSTAHKPNNIFPSEWMLKPWSVGASQYALTAGVLLLLCSPTRPQGEIGRPLLEQAQKHALRVCGLACTNEYAEAWVNSFGPLSFCGRFLTEHRHQLALETMLVRFGRSTAWPVNLIIKELKGRWTQNPQRYI